MVPVPEDEGCKRGARLVPGEPGFLIMRINKYKDTLSTRGLAQSRILIQAGQGKNAGIYALLAFAACGLLHVAIGADPLVSALAIIAMTLGMAPLIRFGVWNIGAFLIFLVAFRYVGFPLFAKLAVNQALDTNLDKPLVAFLAVTVGVFAYFTAFMMVNRIKVGLPLLRPVTTPHLLRRLSVLAFLVGFAANIEFALRVNLQTGSWNISNFFIPCMHLALIAAAASALLRSDGHGILDLWTITVLAVEVVFAFVQNTRTPILESVLALAVTDVAFHGRFTKRQAAITFAAFFLLIAITPVILYVRQTRDDLGWGERITATAAALVNWKEAETAFLAYLGKEALRSDYFMSYYGTPTNIFERLSNVNHTDVLIAGAERNGKLGFEVIDRAVQNALPRLLVPDKPTDYSEGDWIYSEYQGVNRYGNFQTASLIGVGYASFGWIGVFFFPLFFGSAILLLIKKVVGLNLLSNVWVVYTLISVNNQFVEGGTWSNMVMIFRQLPQDAIVMLLFATLIGTNRITFRKV
jgi:hypothetical protein